MARNREHIGGCIGLMVSERALLTKLAREMVVCFLSRHFDCRSLFLTDDLPSSDDSE